MSNPSDHLMVKKWTLNTRRIMKQLQSRAAEDASKLLQAKMAEEEHPTDPFHQLYYTLHTQGVRYMLSYKEACTVFRLEMKDLGVVACDANMQHLDYMQMKIATEAVESRVAFRRVCSWVEHLAETLGDQHVECTDDMVEFVCSVLTCMWLPEEDKYHACLAAFRLPAFVEDMLMQGALDAMIAHIDAAAPLTKLGTASASTLCRLCHAWWKDPSARTQRDAERMMHGVVASLRLFPCHWPNTIQACAALQAFTSDTPSNQVLLCNAGGLPVLLRTLLVCMHCKETPANVSPTDLVGMVVCVLKALWNAVVSTEATAVKNQAEELRVVDVLLEVSWWMRTAMVDVVKPDDMHVVCATLQAAIHRPSPSSMLVKHGGLCEVLKVALAFPTCGSLCVTLLHDCGVATPQAQAVVRALGDTTVPLPTPRRKEGVEETLRLSFVVHDVVEALTFLVGVARKTTTFPIPAADTMQRQVCEQLRDGAVRSRLSMPMVHAAIYVVAALRKEHVEKFSSEDVAALQAAMVDVVCNQPLPLRLAHHIFLALADASTLVHGWMTAALDADGALRDRFERAKMWYKSSDRGTPTWIVGSVM